MSGDIESVKDKRWEADPNLERSTPICQGTKDARTVQYYEGPLGKFYTKLKQFVLHVLNYRMTNK